MDNTNQFNIVLTRRLSRVCEVLSLKAAEYASGQDRYHNFHLAAAIDNETPERALWGMAKKHLVSIIDLIGWVETAPEKVTLELVDEKIGDMINYLILLEGLLNLRCENGER